MVDAKTKSKTTTVLSLIGSILLLVMAIFHGSGFSYISEIINESNSEKFLKEIVPVLFAHPSIHLISLAAFGILTLSLRQEAKRVLVLLALIVIVDALLALYLGGILPGILLMISALCFFIVGFGIKRN